jgi:hypothetical protein
MSDSKDEEVQQAIEALPAFADRRTVQPLQTRQLTADVARQELRALKSKAQQGVGPVALTRRQILSLLELLGI